MDFKQIQELIKMINKSNIGEVTIEEKGFKLTIKQKEEPVQHVMAAPMATSIAMPAALSQAAPSVAAPADNQGCWTWQTEDRVLYSRVDSWKDRLSPSTD